MTPARSGPRRRRRGFYSSSRASSRTLLRFNDPAPVMPGMPPKRNRRVRCSRFDLCPPPSMIYMFGSQPTVMNRIRKTPGCQQRSSTPETGLRHFDTTHPMRSCVSGGVAAGRAILPATRFGHIVVGGLINQLRRVCASSYKSIQRVACQ